MDALTEISLDRRYIFEKVKTLLVLKVNEKVKRSLDELVGVLRRIGIQDEAVKVLVNISRDDVPKFLYASDFGLALLDPLSSKSRQTDLPLKVAEYIACGLPVIYTPFGRIEKVLRDNVHGFKVAHTSRSVAETYERIYRLTDDELIKLKFNVKNLKNFIDLDNYTKEIFHILLRIFIEKTSGVRRYRCSFSSTPFS